jgi:hypothetical protein
MPNKSTQARLPKRTNIDPKNPGYREQYGVIVVCDNETQQRAIYEQLHAQGHRLKVVCT